MVLKMKIEMVMQNAETGICVDIGNLVTSIQWDTRIEDNQPGKLRFGLYKEEGIEVTYGSIVRLKVEEIPVFYGYIFSFHETESKEMTVTAYDQMRYLQNKDTMVFTDSCASQRFKEICQAFSLKYQIVKASSYLCPGEVWDNKSLYDMIQRAVDVTLIHEKEWYVVYDDFGTLTFNSLRNMKTSLRFGDKELLTGYEFTGSIDEDTYNQVKLVKEDTEAKKREIYITKDRDTIRKWGILQHFQKIEEKANGAQIKELAQMILKSKNRPKKTLKITTIGDWNVRAGSGILLNISDLEDKGVGKNVYYSVMACSHQLSNENHRMELDVRVGM
ncbi:hypothetical protein D7X25_22705 [bacterium 1XD42-8]|jgi:hypothetical protein|nr:hypothetical protein [Lachnospiraceae bacterium]RKJ47352.1 hypothetical protein D7X25_22705 [bacterium 1XD42-8]